MAPFFTAPAKDYADLEPQYRAHFLRADISQTSIAIAVWLIPMLIFAYFEYTIFGLRSEFAVLLALRLAFCLFSLYTISALLRTATSRNYERIFLNWSVFATAVILFFNYRWAPFVPPNGAITILILFSAYMVFPTKLTVRLIPALALSAGNLILEWKTSAAANPYALITVLVAIVMANILGVIFSSALEKHRYAEFKLRLEESRIKDEFIRLASIDELTGVFNRRKLMQLAGEEFDRFRKDGQPFSVLMIDIDHFKKLNDHFGHEAGDQVLSKFALYVANKLHGQSIWGRLGGDEFVLVLPGLPIAEAKLIAEELRCGISTDPIWQNPIPTCTISIGLTERQACDQSFESLLNRADKALYHAKQNSRNRTEVL